MCGIIGLIDFSETRCLDIKASLYAMTSTLKHRGPDDSGLWVDEFSGIGLGHTRLSIQDLSAAGHQPMTSICGRYVIVFNGEIYNHLDIRRELDKHLNIRWRGQSDTETLLMAFSYWGTKKTLGKLVGMFAIGLWDLEKKKLVLVRDRVGEKPVYFGKINNLFVFASELNPVKSVLLNDLVIDRASLAKYSNHGYIPGQSTIYENIYKLAPGAYFEASIEDIKNYDVKPKKYWSFEDIMQQGSTDQYAYGDESNATNDLHDCLLLAVKSQTLSDVPLGALLSGGIDSSLVVALLKESGCSNLSTFTIGFDNPKYDESSYAKNVARHLGTRHEEVIMSESDVLNFVPKLPLIYDEPFADSSQLPTSLVMNMVSNHVKVVLTGDGADEIFGGYNRYQKGPRDWAKIAALPKSLRHLIGHCLQKSNKTKYERLGRKLQDANDLDAWCDLMTKNWPTKAGIVLQSHGKSNDERRYFSNFDPATRMMMHDFMNYLPDDILIKVDRAAMHYSVENRAPFLDYRVVELSSRMPTNMKIRNGANKWILRQLLLRYLPESMVNRPKMGFGIPLDLWLRTSLRSWVESLISADRISSEGYFDSLKVEKLWLEHIRGQANNAAALWPIIMFQSWNDHQSNKC